MKHMEHIARQWLAGLLVMVMVFGGTASGSGSETDPYMIENGDQLKKLSDFVKSGND